MDSWAGLTGFSVSFQSGLSKRWLEFGKPKFYVLAITIPLLLAVLTNLISIPLGMKSFGLVSLGTIHAKSGVILISLLTGIFGALGEEIGWRGFLLPKLIEAKIKHPYLISGIIWAAWHIPLVSFGGYYQIDQPLLIALVYSFSVITSGYVIGFLRMRSGSVLVATTIHACHNFFFQLAIPRLVFSGSGPNSKWWELFGADCGVIVGILYLAILLILFKSKYGGKQGRNPKSS